MLAAGQAPLAHATEAEPENADNSYVEESVPASEPVVEDTTDYSVTYEESYSDDSYEWNSEETYSETTTSSREPEPYYDEHGYKMIWRKNSDGTYTAWHETVYVMHKYGVPVSYLGEYVEGIGYYIGPGPYGNQIFSNVDKSEYHWNTNRVMIESFSEEENAQHQYTWCMEHGYTKAQARDYMVNYCRGLSAEVVDRVIGWSAADEKSTKTDKSADTKNAKGKDSKSASANGEIAESEIDAQSDVETVKLALCEKHDYKVTKDIKPTATASGCITKTCSVCGHVKFETVNATGNAETEELFVEERKSEKPMSMVGIIAIVVAALVIAGGAIVGIFMYRKKKL